MVRLPGPPRGEQGLTLFELLITFSLFAVILTLTLYFYAQSVKATRRHDQGSEVYRRAHVLFSDIERFLTSGTLVFADAHLLVVAPFRTEGIMSNERLFQWSKQARSLTVSDTAQLVLQSGAERSEFFKLKTHEGISFAPQEFDEEERERRFDFVTLHFISTPPSVTRQLRPYKFSRQVLLGRY